MQLPQMDAAQAAIAILADRLTAVECESVDIGKCAGRILAEPLVADRDSPALDVSAMDGYAIRLQDVPESPLPISTTTPAGDPPAELQPRTAVQIFTGAPVPSAADCVIRREDTIESADQVLINVPKETLSLGKNIRRRGENGTSGSEVLPSSTLIDPMAMSVVASFGANRLQVRRKVRVTILNTGDELVQAGQPVCDWQIRDSNGPVLEAWLERLSWVELIARRQVIDRLEHVEQALHTALDESDAIILTGGVSMGDTDYVPEAIEKAGGAIAFHRLPIRPGKPVLGASIGGKLVLGLPGNPVSVAITSHVFGLSLLGTLGGMRSNWNHTPQCEITNPDGKHIDLIWYRLVDIDAQGQVTYSKTLGSGDLISLARSRGFVEVPPGQSSAGPWPLFHWQ